MRWPLAVKVMVTIAMSVATEGERALVEETLPAGFSFGSSSSNGGGGLHLPLLVEPGFLAYWEILSQG